MQQRKLTIPNNTISKLFLKKLALLFNEKCMMLNEWPDEYSPKDPS
jgi:hypothetical protein